MATKLTMFISLAAFISLHSTSAVSSTFRRRILHRPLFPLDSPAPAKPPNASAIPPKHTKSNATSHHSPPTPSAHPQSSTPAATGDVSAAPSAATTTASPGSPFFPNYPSLSPPPPSPAASSSSAGEGSLPTFPANISSLVVPHSRSSSSHHTATSPKLIAVTVVLSLVAISLIAYFFLVRRHRHHRDRSLQRHFSKQPPPPPEQTPHSDNAALYPPYTSTSDCRPPKLPFRTTVSTNRSEFLYIGNLAASNSTEFDPSHHENHFESPEIQPLPPLRPLHNHKYLRNSDSDATDSEEFYSPMNSSGRIEIFRSSSTKRASEEALARIEGLQIQAKISKFSSYPDSNSSSPANSARSGPSVLVNSASDSSNSCSPEYIMRPPPIIHRVPPPPPPPPPPSKGRAPHTEPPVLPQPSRSFKSGEQQQNLQAQYDEIRKPKLKGLHWDKVRASSDRVTVWDQLEAGSFA